MIPTLSLYFILLVVAAIFLYLHLTRNFNYWKNRNVLYLKPVLFFGNTFKVFTFKVNIGKFLENLYKSTTDPYAGFFVFDQPFLLIRDPELIKLVLIKDFDHFKDRSLIENRRDDPIGSDILFVIKNPAWKSIRSKITPVFSTAKMRNMVPLILEACDELVNYLNQVAIREKSTETREVSMKFTTDVIATCAFGIKAHCFQHEDAEFRVASRRIFDWNINRAVQMASYFFAPVLVKLFRMKFLDPSAAHFLNDVFWKTLLERENSKAFRGDLIDILIQIRKQNDGVDEDLVGDKLVAQAVMFFTAGFESSGSTVSFSLYELSLNPEIQDRLRKEMTSVIEKHGEITYAAVKDMEYLGMVIDETLRKYPLLPFLDRRCTKTYKIPGTDIVIDKGVPIYVSLLGLHFDPEYHPDPEKYDPERFSYENKPNIINCTYMPFGEGPHNCIATRFGLLTTKLALIRILKDFIVELSEDTPVPLEFDMKGFLIAPVDGLRLHFKRVDGS